jgi:hypothetical protein
MKCSDAIYWRLDARTSSSNIKLRPESHYIFRSLRDEQIRLLPGNF